MKKQKQVRAYGFGGLLILLLIVVVVLVGVGVVKIPKNCSEGTKVLSVRAAAEENEVLADLGKDETFNIEDYPEDKSDATLTLVQLAESEDKQLFAYIYSPSGRDATEIRFSSSIGENFAPKDYSLTFRAASGGIRKYVVADFEVKDDIVRYYDVIQIARAWDENVDELPEGENKASTVPYKVANLWTACTFNGTVMYTKKEQTVVTITSKYCGFLRYPKGFYLLTGKQVESHYVAFSTDMDIYSLLNVSMTYVSKPYHRTDRFRTDWTGTTFDSEITYGEEETVELDLDEKDTSAYFWGGIFHRSHKWKRIQSVEEFIDSEDLTDEETGFVEDKQWILRFCETDYTFTSVSSSNGTTDIWDGTEISDVSLLKMTLTFEEDGKAYTLGIVDNKQTEGETPGNNPEGLFDGIKDLLEKIWDALQKVFDFFGKAFKFVAANWKWFVLGLVIIVCIPIIVQIILAIVNK